MRESNMSMDEVKRFLDWLQEHDRERRRFQEMSDKDVADAAMDLGFSFSGKELQQVLQEKQQTGWTFFR
jgi:hypothetical protein